MNVLDRAIAFFAPEWAVNRITARATLQQIDGLAGNKAGYNAGKVNLNTKGRFGAETKEHAIPLQEIARLRWQSWGLWRNSPYARKIVRSLQSKVIGRGMVPESLAVNDDGSPNTEFRARAKELWSAIQSGLDSRGLPGRGGLTMAGLQTLALRATILSGEVLYRLVPITKDEQLQRDLPIPFVLQTIDAARLADANHPATEGTIPDGHTIYRGIEVDQNGKRIAYWINQYKIGFTNPTYGSAVRVPAEQVGHLFVEDDIDQLRGVPWFAAALLQVRDTDDLQYNVLKASAMSACVVMGYRKPTGAQRFGLQQTTETNPDSADGSDLTDADGNAITKIQPGMFVNLGKDGALEGFSPNQSNTNAEAFIQHMLRGTAAAFPGVKSSTVTGDYRNSSFSSETSSDNDTWPEIEEVQAWFAANYCQPIYEAVIRAGVLVGWFDGIVGAEEFGAAPGKYTSAKWQGPVSRAINPTDNANAAGLRVKFGLSSMQMECAALNVNWMDVLNHTAELYETAKQKSIPQEVVNNILGVTSQDVIAQSLSNAPAKPATEVVPA
jgi:lambda family phage portal protein